MDESLKYDHSNKNYWAERSCGTVYYAVHNGLTFESEDEILQSVTIQMKPTEQYFPVVLIIMLYKVVLTFESVDEILQSVTIQMKATEQHFRVVLFIMLYKVV